MSIEQMQNQVQKVLEFFQITDETPVYHNDRFIYPALVERAFLVRGSIGAAELMDDVKNRNGFLETVNTYYQEYFLPLFNEWEEKNFPKEVENLLTNDVS